VLALKTGEIHSALFEFGMDFNKQFLMGSAVDNHAAYLKACEPHIARLSEGCHLRTQDSAALRQILDALGDEPAQCYSTMQKILEGLKADEESHYAVIMNAGVAVNSTKPGGGQSQHHDITVNQTVA
jgi:hypothetical protein